MKKTTVRVRVRAESYVQYNFGKFTSEYVCGDWISASKFVLLL